MLSTKEHKHSVLIAKSKSDNVYLSRDYKNGSDSLQLTKGKFTPILSEAQRVIYIVGKSGSGKSYFTSMMIKKYQKSNPNNKVYLFSLKPVGDDEAFTDLDLEYVCLDDDFIESEITYDSFPEDSLIVFDDTDTAVSGAIQKKIIKIQDQILEMGRKKKLKIIITSHLFSDYKKSRIVLNELHCIVLFKSGMKHKIRSSLKQKFGVEDSEITKMLELDSRWFMFSVSDPQYVVSENDVFIVDG